MERKGAPEAGVASVLLSRRRTRRARRRERKWRTWCDGACCPRRRRGRGGATHQKKKKKKRDEGKRWWEAHVDATDEGGAPLETQKSPSGEEEEGRKEDDRFLSPHDAGRVTMVLGKRLVSSRRGGTTPVAHVHSPPFLSAAGFHAETNKRKPRRRTERYMPPGEDTCRVEKGEGRTKGYEDTEGKKREKGAFCWSEEPTFFFFFSIP